MKRIDKSYEVKVTCLDDLRKMAIKWESLD